MQFCNFYAVKLSVYCSIIAILSYCCRFLPHLAGVQLEKCHASSASFHSNLAGQTHQTGEMIFSK